LIAEYSGYATMVFMIGWASGGVLFGILGDRIGRVKDDDYDHPDVLAVHGSERTLSTAVWDFSVYRFLTGLGVGGQFAVGVALVAETMPDRARPFALGWLQALSAIGNMMAAVIGITLGHLEESGAVGSAWRWMFIMGALPAFPGIPIFRRLKEPESWTRARRRKPTSGASAICSPIRDGGGTRLSECCLHSPVWSACGESVSSASICSDR
jgi:MFS family permease